MRIAFITPSPTTLKHDWYRDLPYQKVGVPNLAGYLKRAGYPDITQYDFNNQVLRAHESAPARVRLMTYSDDRAVRRFLRGDDPVIRGQTEFLLDTLGVTAHDLFGISLSHFLGDGGEIQLGERLSECLAKVIKERFPGCVVAVGGLQNMSLDFQDEGYRRMLNDCAHIDYAVSGEAHRMLLGICRAVEAGKAFLPGRDYRCRKVNNGRIISIRERATGGSDSRYFEPLPAAEVRDPSVPRGFPAYDRDNSAAYAYSGRRIRGFYHLPDDILRYSKRADARDYLLLQVSFSEGCRFNCFFCSGAQSKFFSLGLDESVDMLKSLRDGLGCRHFLFYNPNFNPTYRYARSFLEKLVKADLGILWADCFNLRNMDRDLIALMREAGVVKVVTGVECPTKRMLKYINKGLSLDAVYRNLEELDQAGIWNHVLLITGLPSETWDDVREMEGWLKATSGMVDAYTVGSFHMAFGSPFYREPEKFGFTVREAMRLYCQSSFDEEGGLRWAEKQRLNLRSNSHIREFIDDLKGSRKPTAARMDDSHLLMYLYRALGHGRKRLIAKMHEAAYTVNPHAVACRVALSRQLSVPGSSLNAFLRARGLTLKPGPAELEVLPFTLAKDGAAVSCRMRARSEDVLLNPAPGRFHGHHFMLTAQALSGSGPGAASINRSIPEALRLIEDLLAAPRR